MRDYFDEYENMYEQIDPRDYAEYYAETYEDYKDYYTEEIEDYYNNDDYSGILIVSDPEVLYPREYEFEE